jgi:hypothetical protein
MTAAAAQDESYWSTLAQVRCGHVMGGVPCLGMAYGGATQGVDGPCSGPP